jgi:hypothetical protein
MMAARAFGASARSQGQLIRRDVGHGSMGGKIAELPSLLRLNLRKIPKDTFAIEFCAQCNAW